MHHVRHRAAQCFRHWLEHRGVNRAEQILAEILGLGEQDIEQPFGLLLQPVDLRLYFLLALLLDLRLLFLELILRQGKLREQILLRLRRQHGSLRRVLLFRDPLRFDAGQLDRQVEPGLVCLLRSRHFFSIRPLPLFSLGHRHRRFLTGSQFRHAPGSRRASPSLFTLRLDSDVLDLFLRGEVFLPLLHLVLRRPHQREHPLTPRGHLLLVVLFKLLP